LFGKAKHADLLPTNSRAAAPAALLNRSGSILDSISPNPVKTINREVFPGNLIISSALPVAPIAVKVARSEVVSIWEAPDSIFNFLFTVPKPTTKTSLSNLSVSFTLTTPTPI